MILVDTFAREPGRELDLGSAAKRVAQLADAEKLDQKYIACRIPHAATVRSAYNLSQIARPSIFLAIAQS